LSNTTKLSPSEDRGHAIAVVQRLAIDIAENRQDCLGKGYSVSVVDDAGSEIHRESIDSAEAAEDRADVSFGCNLHFAQ
jgi:hypothetical protein